MTDAGGQWFGDYDTPTVLSQAGRKKRAEGQPLDASSYGRKESEGKDYNEDTNFGKLKRIPHPGLQQFLSKFRLTEVTEDAGSMAEVFDELPPRTDA